MTNYNDACLHGKVDAIKTKGKGFENFDAIPFEAIKPSLYKLNTALQLFSNCEPYDLKLDLKIPFKPHLSCNKTKKGSNKIV